VLEPLNINYKYVHNQPKLGMAANWNHSIKLASGKYVLVLHDDDFLLPHAVETIIKAINENKDRYPVMLFGVDVVDEQEKLIRKQLFKRRLYFSPKKALLKVLSNSSFIRFPGIVIRRDSFTKLDYFNTDIGEVCDLDMWIKLLSNYGLLCLPDSISAYTVHSNALTTGMFNLKTIQQLQLIFHQIKQKQILSSTTLQRSQTDFLHQFILAGTYRQMRQFQFKEAAGIMDLFNTSDLRKLPISAKWLLLRISFTLILIITNLWEVRKFYPLQQLNSK
jgi:glycosyltransferase involved in cell wall biosynthesis